MTSVAGMARVGRGLLVLGFFTAPPATSSVRAEPPAAGAAPALAPFRDPAGDARRRFLERRVADDLDDYTAWNRLGGEWLQRMRASGDLAGFPLAAEAARRSLASVPADRNPGGLLLRARVEMADHRFRDATATARELAKLSPGQASTWETLGDALLEGGDFPGAADAFRELARRTAGDGSPEVEARLARLALARGDRASARETFGRTLTLASAAEAPETAAFAHVQLGRLDFEEGRWPESEAHYRAALQAAPASAAAFVNLAELAGARGENDVAQRLYVQLIERVPRPEFCHELADFLSFIGRKEDARPWAERALAGYRASAETRGERMHFHHLAAFFSDTRESPDEAVRWAERDLEQRHGPAAREALAWAFYRGGRFAEAAAEMDRALTGAGAAATAHQLNHAALIFFRGGDPDRGAECLRRARILNPNLDRFHAHR